MKTWPMTKLEREKEALTAKLRGVQTRIDAEKARTLIPCEHCRKKTQVRRLLLIRDYWYTPPHGCTEGDYWNEGEGSYICPHCMKANRLHDFGDEDRKRQWIDSELHRFFAAEFEKHDYGVGSSLGHQERFVVDADEVERFEREWQRLYGRPVNPGRRRP